jgi:hypothetical protein
MRFVQDHNDVYELWTHFHNALKCYVVRPDIDFLHVLHTELVHRNDILKEQQYPEQTWDTIGLSVHCNVATNTLNHISRVQPDLLQPKDGNIPHLMVLATSLNEDFEGTFELLVRHGADPNQNFVDTTPWAIRLSLVFAAACTNPEYLCRDSTLSLNVFLRHKVNLDVTGTFDLYYYLAFDLMGPVNEVATLPRTSHHGLSALVRQYPSMRTYHGKAGLKMPTDGFFFSQKYFRLTAPDG